jgi:hypothetical protein
MKKLLLPLAVLVPFTVYSTVQVAQHGYLAFLDLAQRPWGIQVLLDLVIAVSLFAIWMRRDARERGLPFLPYFVACLFLGSVGALGYLVHRALRERSAAPGFPRHPGVAPTT